MPNDDDIRREPYFSLYFMPIVMRRVSEEKLNSLYPPCRREKILATKSEKRRAEMYAVWSLLNVALKHAAGLNMQSLTFSVSESGKWEAAGVNFSLSHTEAMALAGVATNPMGADIESVVRFAEKVKGREDRLAEKICGEKCLVNAETLAESWTAKESAFKLRGGGAFNPAKTDGSPAKTGYITLGGERYCFSFCGKDVGFARFYSVSPEDFSLTEVFPQFTH